MEEPPLCAKTRLDAHHVDRALAPDQVETAVLDRQVGHRRPNPIDAVIDAGGDRSDLELVEIRAVQIDAIGDRGVVTVVNAWSCSICLWENRVPP